MWRTNGAILEYTLGTRKFPKDTEYNIEFYHRNIKILDGFKQIGGKSELSDAKLIWLLEDHLDEIHHENNIDLIVSIAKSDRGKKGIIVLMEAIPTGEEVDKQKFLFLRIDAHSRVFENQEEIADTLWKKSLPFASLDNVSIFGCDDQKLIDDSKKHSLSLSRIEHEKEEYKQSENWKKVSELNSRSKLEREKLRKMGVQRNITWLNTYSDMREENPEAIIIGIGGRNHFTEDPNFTEKLENLENESYIALDPMHQLPREEQIKRSNKYYRK